MANALADDDNLHDPAAAGEDAGTAGFIAKARLLMVISGVTTLIAIAAVLGVIGYRIFTAEGSAPATAPDVTALMPKGTRVVAISTAQDRIVVTIEIAGTLEARTFDARTLRPAGRLKFATEP